MSNALSGLTNPAKMGQDVQTAFQSGRDMAKQQQQQNALTAYAANPNDVGARNALMTVAPEMAIRLGENHRKETEFQDNRRFNQAAVRYNAPSKPKAEQPVLSERDQAFHDMMQIDPTKAMKIDSDARTQALDRLKAVDDGYDLAIARLGAVGDEDTYQATLRDVSARFQPLGIDISTMVPPTYPGPDGIRKLLQSAMGAKEQLAALDRRDRLDADIEDDETDNDRADLEAGNRNANRNRSSRNAEQRTEIARTRPTSSPRNAKAPKVTATNPKTGETISVNSRGEWVDKNGKPIQ